MTQSEQKESMRASVEKLKAAGRLLQDRAEQQERQAKEEQAAQDERIGAIIHRSLPDLERKLAAIEKDPERTPEEAAQVANAYALLNRHAPGWRVLRREREKEERRLARAPKERPRLETLLGCEIVQVPLIGKYGLGRTATVDAVDWRRLAPEFGEVWGVVRTGNPVRERVATTRVEARKAAERIGFLLGKAPIVTLARVIAEATPGQEIIYVDGDPLNLRFGNLHVVARRDLHLFERSLFRGSTLPHEIVED